MTANVSDPAVEELLSEQGSRASSPPPAREAGAELAAAFLLVAACAGIALVFPAGEWSHPAVVVALVCAYALVGRVRFDVGAGYTTPTQIVLVPMLFAMPLSAVPLVVAAGALLRRAPDLFGARQVHPLRLVVTIPDAWHAVGPALVLAAAGGPQPALAHWPLYLAAFAAQAVFDAGSGVVRERIALGLKPALQLRLLGSVVAVDAALAPLGLLAALTMTTTPAALLLVLPLAWLLARFARQHDERIRQALELSSAYRGTALLMGDVLEADDAYTGGEHTHGVAALALAVGDELGLSARQRRDLEFGSLLHDIGKLRVPKEIINKPGRLTEAEWEVIRRHPADGQAMLDRVGGTLSDIGRIVRAHHERVDGGGYPDGLRGDQIPLEARIICACDAFSAMTTDRPYRSAMSWQDAGIELRRESGRQFDADVVDALLRVTERLRPSEQQAPVRLVARVA